MSFIDAAAPIHEHCATCKVAMPERSLNSPQERRCETCWWRHNLHLWHEDRDMVHPLALPVLDDPRRHDSLTARLAQQ